MVIESGINFNYFQRNGPGLTRGISFMRAVIVCGFLLLLNCQCGPAVVPQAHPPTLRVDELDHDVMEAVVLDLLDPSNPEYNLGPRSKALWLTRRIVFDIRTETARNNIVGEESLSELPDDLTIPKSLVRNWKRRNLQDSVPTSSFRIAHRRLTFANLTKIYEDAKDAVTAAEIFESQFPDAAYHVCPYLPGFTDDGLQALVVLDTGPFPHSVVWVYRLEVRDCRWRILWRHRKIWE